jgi:diguanylate cyclase (GGDEF)-like protein
VLFDVDDLRALNGRYGHVEVDRLLALLGSVIRERCGVGEMSARLGGDEFAMSLLEDEPSEVIREVDHIRGRFGEATDGATLSVGICDGRTLARAPVRPSLLEAADSALWEGRKARSRRAEHLSRRVTPNTGPANLPVRLPDPATCAGGGGCGRAREELALLGEC